MLAQSSILLGLAGTLLASGFCRDQEATAHPLTVCEVIHEVETLRGRIVKVKGRILRSSHGMVMIDPHPYPCASSLPDKKRKWDLILDVSSTQSSLVRKEGMPSFGPEGYSRLLKAVKARNSTKVVTVIGELRFRPDFRLIERNNNVVAGTGYGQMGLCPAQIVVKDFAEDQ